MANRSTALTTVKGGINRQRIKGGALEDSLYDLLNAYVTVSRTVKVRPGTFRHALLPTDTAGDNYTKGLCSFDGSLHVFSTELVDVPTGFTLHILAHPDGGIELETIHFAAPFLGFLYVVAEFVGGDIYHFWLQTGVAWEANRIYFIGDVVEPSTPNGFSYQATRNTSVNAAWAADVVRAIDDVIEPTVYNGYLYTVTDTQGDNPRSGKTEPTWPAVDGQTVNEDADRVAEVAAVFAEQPDPAQFPPCVVRDRYGPIGSLIGRLVNTPDCEP